MRAVVRENQLLGNSQRIQIVKELPLYIEERGGVETRGLFLWQEEKDGKKVEKKISHQR